MLAPLTKLTYIKRNFKWTEVKQDDVNKINWIFACDTLSTYPDSNENFRIYTDASTLQFWAVVSKKGKPIVLYSKNIIDAQQWYTVTGR